MYLIFYDDYNEGCRTKVTTDSRSIVDINSYFGLSLALIKKTSLSRRRQADERRCTVNRSRYIDTRSYQRYTVHFFTIYDVPYTYIYTNDTYKSEKGSRAKDYADDDVAEDKVKKEGSMK